MAATLGTGLAVGLVNAGAILRLRIPPLLATLAVMNICAGLELVLTENTTIPASSPLIDALGGTGPLDRGRSWAGSCSPWRWALPRCCA